MASPSTAAPLILAHPSLPKLRAAAADCRACDLWKRGTQTVFGEGGAHAEVLFIGEQPGNDEDLAGRPFVGPAGKLLDRALAAAGIDRSQFRVSQQRGEPVRSPLAPYVTAIVHPSAILRAPDDATRQAEMERFVADLIAIRDRVSGRLRASRGT